MYRSERASLILSLGLCAVLLPACDDLLTGAVPRIAVKPTELVFRGATPRALPYELELRISNIGSKTLVIDRLELSGDEHFTLQEDAPQRLSIEPQREVPLLVRFLAEDGLVRRATLTLHSNDGTTPRKTVPLSTDPVVPRLVVTDCVPSGQNPLPTPPDMTGCLSPIDDLLVDFGTVTSGQCRPGRIVIENTGKARLKVERGELLQAAHAGFTFVGLPPTVRELEAIGDDGFTDKLLLDVKFCPTVSGSLSATLALRSNDPDREDTVVTLRGDSRGTAGPTCTCTPATREVLPQDVVRLTASCVDPDGQPLQYAWSMVGRPPGSTEPIQGANSQAASFAANTATTPQHPYVARVTATDADGLSDSCDYTVFAVPRDALHIQVVWDTDRTDIDLHLLNPQGSASPWSSAGWNSTTNDAYYLNPRPDWGVRGVTEDNPGLDLDDVNGYGPENINLARPASGKYRVGVHSFCNPVTTRATVRIFCAGTLAQEIGPRTLGATNAFWEAAEITWPGCQVRVLNEAPHSLPGQCIGF